MSVSKQRLALFAAALWWGSLTAVGAWVVPMLFAYLPSPALAGNTAARLFAAQTWVAMACGLLLLMALPRERMASASARSDARGNASLTGWVLAGMLLALLSEFAIAPRIVARENLRLWHGLGTAVFAAQWACAGWALWRLSAAGVSRADPS